MYGEILRCLQALYTSVTSSVRINSNTLPPIQINCGLKQRCTLSPTLSNRHIINLIDCLDQTDVGITSGGHKVNASFYADNLVLFADSSENSRDC